MDNTTISILVVDDEQKIIEVIKTYLENIGYKVHTANNGKKALDLFESIKPSLIILDLMLPDMSGEQVCKNIRKKSRVPIIMLTAKVSEDDLLTGLDIGADDYITKPFSPKQLVARVNAVIRRSQDDSGLLSNIISFDNDGLVIDLIKHGVKINNKDVNLTPNEFNILKNLIKYPKKVFTRDELINYALGEDFEGYDRVIDTHIKNLRQKIEPDPKNPKYILTVHGIGYRFGIE
jgi:DNA-binding response OmpR family regulator